MASFAASLPVMNSFVRGRFKEQIFRRHHLLPFRFGMGILFLPADGRGLAEEQHSVMGVALGVCLFVLLRVLRSSL